eukprot:7043376-Prymnesium_polylepis.1
MPRVFSGSDDTSLSDFKITPPGAGRAAGPSTWRTPACARRAAHSNDRWPRHLCSCALASRRSCTQRAWPCAQAR